MALKDFLDLTQAGVKGAREGGMESITLENSEENGIAKETITLTAEKHDIHSRKKFITVVEITNGTQISVQGAKTQMQFSAGDMLRLERKRRVAVKDFISILRYILFGFIILCGLLSGLFYISILGSLGIVLSYFWGSIDAVKVKLVNGSEVLIYYNKEEDAAILEEKLGQAYDRAKLV